MKLQDLLETKKLKASVMLNEEFEKKDEPDEEEVGETKKEEESEPEDALSQDPSDFKDEDEGTKSSEEGDSESEEGSSEEEDGSYVFTLSVEDISGQKTIFVKMGEEAAKDDDDADAAIDEAEAVEQIVNAMGGKKEITGTIESLKEDGIDLSEVLEYYEKELQEKMDAVEELESELGIQDGPGDEDEEELHGIHDELEDAGVMSGVEDDEASSEDFPEEDYPSDNYEGFHLDSLDRHGVNPNGYTAKFDFDQDMMDPTASLHPEARESEFFDPYA